MSARRATSLVRGLIVRASTADPAGRNPKKRPVVLLTSENEVPAGEPLIGIGITGSLPNPLAPEYVLLPWHRAKHPFTGLNKKCAARCRWRITIPITDDLEAIGRVPDKVFAEICTMVNTIQAELTEPGA